MKTSFLLLLGLALVLLAGWLLTRKAPAPMQHASITHGHVPVLHRTPGQTLRHVGQGPPAAPPTRF